MKKSIPIILAFQILLLITSGPVLAYETTVEEELQNEVRKVINSGLLRPGYYPSGVDSIVLRTKADQLQDYFHNPADTIWTLLWALPHLPDKPYPDDPTKTWKEKVREYVQNVYTTYPLDKVTHIGWKSGIDRDSYILPNEIAGGLTGGTSSYSPFNGWTFHPFSFYAAWKYAAEFGNASSILQSFNRSSGPLLPIPPNYNPNDLSGMYDFFKNNPNRQGPGDAIPNAVNIYIAGYMGYLGLQDSAGVPRSIQYQQILNDLLALRLNMFDTIDPGVIRGSEVGGFLYLVPELGDYLYQNRRARVQTYVDVYDDIMPYWFATGADEQIRDNRLGIDPVGGNGGSETATTQAYAPNSLFLARALALKQSRYTLEEYLDVPAFDRGDLFYIQNLIATIEAPTSGTQPTSTPTLLPGDLNGDNVVNILDFTILSNAFGTNDNSADINDDGIVNVLDFTILSNNFGRTS